MKKDFYKRNRKNLLDKMSENSLLILFAGEAPKKTADEKYPFTPNRNFYYLTGIDEEKHVLVLLKLDGNIEEYLFIKEVMQHFYRLTEYYEVRFYKGTFYKETEKLDIGPLMTNEIVIRIFPLQKIIMVIKIGYQL